MDFASKERGASNEHASLKNFRENWDAAWELIQGWENSGRTDWNAGITEYPPPTAGTTPLMGHDEDLIAAPFAEVVDGTPTQGFDLAWIPVPDDYVDPITGVNDFKEYRFAALGGITTALGSGDASMALAYPASVAHITKSA